MSIENKKRVYSSIGSGRLLDIKVMLDEKEIYTGMVEDAPEEVRRLKYSKVEFEDKITYYVYSEFN